MPLQIHQFCNSSVFFKMDAIVYQLAAAETIYINLRWRAFNDETTFFYYFSLSLSLVSSSFLAAILRDRPPVGCYWDATSQRWWRNTARSNSDNYTRGCWEICYRLRQASKVVVTCIDADYNAMVTLIVWWFVDVMSLASKSCCHCNIFVVGLYLVVNRPRPTNCYIAVLYIT